MSDPIHILFLCVANSARSQLAEGIAKSVFGERVKVESAGSEPSGKVNPWAVKILSKNGIDISQNSSKGISQLPQKFVENLDFVITLCAQEVCPAFISKATRLNWPIPDPAKAPADQTEKAFQEAFDSIYEKLTHFGEITFPK